MQCAECDEFVIRDAEFGQQRLHRRDLVGLLGDINVGEHERGIGGERAQHLRRGTVVKIVEAAAQRLAIQGDATLSGRGVRCLQQRSMAAKDRLHRGRIEPLENVADSGVRGCAAPFQTERGVQPVAMDADEGDDAPIRVAAGHDGDDGVQQHVGQPVALTLPTTAIGNFGEQAQQRRDCSHGNLRPGCRPRSQTSADPRIPIFISRFISLRRRCMSDSLQPI